MQVHAQGGGFLKISENICSSPLVRASGVAVLCPGIYLSLGEHLHPLLLTAPTWPPIDFSLSWRESESQALNYLNYQFSLYLCQMASVGLCRKSSPFIKKQKSSQVKSKSCARKFTELRTHQPSLFVLLHRGQLLHEQISAAQEEFHTSSKVSPEF